MLFWAGQPSNLYNSVVPVPFFLLTVDRCLSLRFTDVRRLRTGLFLFCCAWLAAVVLFTLGVSCYGELPLNATAIAGCQNTVCTFTRYKNLPVTYVKCVAGTVNLLLAAYFLLLFRAWRLRQREMGSGGSVVKSDSSLKNRVVRGVVIVEVTVSILPAYIGSVFGIVSGREKGEEEI